MFQEVTLKIPTFQLDSKLEANEIFQKMHISQIFIDAELDLVTTDKPLGIWHGNAYYLLIKTNTRHQQYCSYGCC